MKALSHYLLFFCALLPLLVYGQSSVSTKPNIIYIMVDDLGYADLSCYGRKDYQTPMIDRFVKEGMNFTQAYSAAPVCTPTRVAFMTGKFPARTALGLREPLTRDPEDLNLGLPANTASVSSLLQKNGYQTALIGKWHLGFNQEFLPTRHGFDYFFGITSGGVDYVTHQAVQKLPAKFNALTKSADLYENEKQIERKGYLTDLLTKQAVAFLKQKHTKPFFLSLQYTAPHWPWQAPTDGASTDSLFVQDKSKAGSFKAMMENLDKNFGKVLSAIEQEGLNTSTLIIFTSDNGGEEYSDMGPFKGRKMTLWEGGIRVPAAVQWQGVIKAGTECKQLVITMDWSATILAAAGITPPKDWDGMNLLPYLKGKAAIVSRTFYWRTANRVQAQALRQGDWKYLQNKDGEFLFNLAEDPYENVNLKDKSPQKLEELKEAFARLNQQMLPPLVLAVPVQK
jgi:arylsulfatase A-like enzyme